MYNAYFPYAYGDTMMDITPKEVTHPKPIPRNLEAIACTRLKIQGLVDYSTCILFEWSLSNSIPHNYTAAHALLCMDNDIGTLPTMVSVSDMTLLLIVVFSGASHTHTLVSPNSTP